MADKINVTIDGKKIEVQEGANLIDAAETGGIHIPNLCYLKGLKGIGACRMCLVEVEGMKVPLTACTTKTKDGMVVNTKTEAVEEVRKFVTDLIVSMHPLDCMTCTKASSCNLMKYAYDFEIKESTFSRKSFGFGYDDANPFIKLDPDYCVLCAKCVRICKHQGTNILEFKGRGVGMKVIAGSDQPLHETDCTFCGSCIDVCPVNAILEADRWRKGREWDYEKQASVCLLCGNACDIVVSKKNGMVRKINTGREGDAENYICSYGRFGFDCINADTRITAPLKRVNGELQETTWEDAVETIAKKLANAGENAAFVSAASILNEDALTLSKLAADVVKTKKVSTTASLYGSRETLISGGADMASADLFVLVGLDPDQWKKVLPALDALIRKKIDLNAKLITINSCEPRIASAAAVSLTEDEPEALRALAKAIMEKGTITDEKVAGAVSGAVVTEAIEKAASLFVESKNPVILSSPALYQAASNIALFRGNAVSVPLESNAKGVLLMGLGGEKTFNEVVSDKSNKLLYVIGEVPLNGRPDVDFLVVQASHRTGLSDQADLVLPATAYLETEGTIVDYLGRLRQVNKGIDSPEASRENRDIFADIAKAMGSKMKAATEKETSKLAKISVKPSLKPFSRAEGPDTNPEELMLASNASVINGSRLLWLKEAVKGLACSQA